MAYVTDPRSPTYSSNVRQLCLTEAENERLYADFICRGYANGCSTSDRAIVMSHIERVRKAAAGREIFNTFKVRAALLVQRTDQGAGALLSVENELMWRSPGEASSTAITSRPSGRAGSTRIKSSANSLTTCLGISSTTCAIARFVRADTAVTWPSL